MASATKPEPTRRDFLYIATGAVGAVGAAADGVAVHRPDESHRRRSGAGLHRSGHLAHRSRPAGRRSNGAAIPCSCAAARRRRSPKPRAVDVLRSARSAGAQRQSARQRAGHRRQPRDQAGMADPDRRLHPSGLHAHRLKSARRLRRLALPLPRLAIRHRRPHPQRPGAAESGGAALRLPSDTRVKVG